MKNQQSAESINYLPVSEANDKSEKSEQERFKAQRGTSKDYEMLIETSYRTLFALVSESTSISYEVFEKRLIEQIFALGRLFIGWYLCLCEDRTSVQPTEYHSARIYRRQPAKSRELGTYFGKVRYWRTYLYNAENKGGFYPVDKKLGLTSDSFSLGTLSRTVQLATKMSYSAAHKVYQQFLGWSPSIKTIEEATLGLGSYTSAWFEQSPAPTDDGEVLVIQIDSKAIPTATEEELAKRRQPRQHQEKGRRQRQLQRLQRISKPRKKKGDKSKNGRMATLVVMYSLKETKDNEGKTILEGPINRRIYASLSSKKHAFAIAQREAQKRGFGAEKKIQIVTDGDKDLHRYTQEFFPQAIHSLDIIHAIEYLWKAGSCLYKEGSNTLQSWVQKQKDLIYKGRIRSIIRTIQLMTSKVPSKSKRRKLAKIVSYFKKRIPMMNYHRLRQQNLELSSGLVEGAIRYVISQRFDEGGMRWIKERAEFLLQLRCIEINGDWDNFIEWTHRQIIHRQNTTLRPETIRRSSPAKLPTT